ncbi:hypothetical protein E2C01_076758 [Portunus trituberculatus]|uniref:Uncharacterized protein n=1 Tax=Portunus trituberculatus TaxID=210409 RepID=A0A5B7IIG8_PORTR|nr:hypothetical protein [Portunus trituberculatus]
MPRLVKLYAKERTRGWLLVNLNSPLHNMLEEETRLQCNSTHCQLGPPIPTQTIVCTNSDQCAYQLRPMCVPTQTNVCTNSDHCVYQQLSLIFFSVY